METKVREELMGLTVRTVQEVPMDQLETKVIKVIEDRMEKQEQTEKEGALVRQARKVSRVHKVVRAIRVNEDLPELRVQKGRAVLMENKVIVVKMVEQE